MQLTNYNQGTTDYANCSYRVRTLRWHECKGVTNTTDFVQNPVVWNSYRSYLALSLSNDEKSGDQR